MDLLEYQGKQLFAKHGIAVPAGSACHHCRRGGPAGDELGYPVVVKAQVLIGGRGKAGGIKLAKDRAEVEEHAGAHPRHGHQGPHGARALRGAATDIEEEYYAAFVFDRGAKKPMAMLSKMGGMDVEAIVEEDPAAMSKLHVDPLIGFQDFHARRLAFEAGIAADVIRPVGAMLARLYETFVAEDAMLVEVNPADREPPRGAGARRQGHARRQRPLPPPGLGGVPQLPPRTRRSAWPRSAGSPTCRSTGTSGSSATAPGLVMSTLDVVAQAGGRPANFLDAGGGSKAEAITSAVEVILNNPHVTAVLFNIFGGITRCDEVARGLIEAFAQIEPDVPFVVRLDGTNDVEGRALLAEANLPERAHRVDDARGRRARRGAGRLMAVLVDSNTRLCVSGITGREGTFHSLNNRGYGTQVVSGVTPGKGGQDVEGIPVFDTFHEAVAETGANTAMVFVPPRFAADSILEAEDAGIELIVTITEGIPAHDELRVYNHLQPERRAWSAPTARGSSPPGRPTWASSPRPSSRRATWAWCRAPAR